MNRHFEIILKGFDGSTDKTDHLILWASAPTKKHLEKELSRRELTSQIHSITEELFADDTNFDFII